MKTIRLLVVSLSIVMRAILQRLCERKRKNKHQPEAEDCDFDRCGRRSRPTSSRGLHSMRAGLSPSVKQFTINLKNKI